MLMGKWVAGREREDGRRTLVTSASAVRSTSTLKSEWNTNGIDREDKRERKREIVLQYDGLPNFHGQFQ